MVDVVNKWLIFSLLSIHKLHHTYSSLGTIEAIEEFMLHLVSIVNVHRRKVCVPIKNILLDGPNKLFNQEVTFFSCIDLCFNEVGNVLLWIFISIK